MTGTAKHRGTGHEGMGGAGKTKRLENPPSSGDREPRGARGSGVSQLGVSRDDTLPVCRLERLHTRGNGNDSGAGGPGTGPGTGGGGGGSLS